MPPPTLPQSTLFRLAAGVSVISSDRPGESAQAEAPRLGLGFRHAVSEQNEGRGEEWEMSLRGEEEEAALGFEPET